MVADVDADAEDADVVAVDDVEAWDSNQPMCKQDGSPAK